MRALLLFLLSFFAGIYGNISLGEAKQPLLRGNWEITFCRNPDKQCELTLCFEFTRNTGEVSEMTRSGTWIWWPYISTGRWVQDGDVVQLFAGYGYGAYQSYISFTGMMNGSERLGGISYVDALVDGTFIATGTWFANKVKTCPRMATAKSRDGLVSHPQ